jgi:nitrous oxidase accessory protein NosD
MAVSATRLRKSLFTITAFVLLQWPAVAAQAQTQITHCLTFINAPGQYVLANDLTNCTYGVVISVADVQLNLAGHRITGSSNASGDGIKTQSNAARIRIQGPGVISNFGNGVLLDAGSAELSAVTCTGNMTGFYVHKGMVRVHDNIATNNMFGFIMGVGASGEVRQNLASGNTGDGFVAEGAGGRGGARFMHNTAVFNGRYGIIAEDRTMQNEIIGNTALDNATYDLFDGNRTCQNTWADNTFGTSKGPCIH